jgi:photosystem II stability/assembly factor-like uncharacterized protein
MAGQNGAIKRTTDAGNTWISQREPNHYFNSVYFVDENTGWAVSSMYSPITGETDSGIVLHTTNGGETWERQIVSNNLVLNSIYAFDNQNVIVAGEENQTSNSVILQTSNGGETWQTQTDTMGTLNSICFVSRNTGWLIGKGIFKTTDGGITWHSQRNLIGLNKVQFINENIGWASYSNDSILTTTNGGENWSSYLIDSTISVNTFDFVDANYGWMLVYLPSNEGGYGIYRTTNGGTSWSACVNAPAIPYTCIQFINKDTGWAAGSYVYSTIVKTTNGGTSWNLENGPSTNTISNIFILDGNTGWAVGNGIFKTTNGGGFVAVKEKNNNANIPKQITLFQNYPNPFNPSTMINYQLPAISYVTLKVYDILGREVKTLINGIQQAGTHSVSFNAAGLSSGVYFYRLNSANFVQTKKLMVIK